MNKVFEVALSAMIALGVILGSLLFTAPAAQAYTARYTEYIRCDWVDTWYEVDYDWAEEFFQRKKDVRMYIGTKFRYNAACHGSWVPF